MSNIYANNINPRSGNTVTFPQNIKVLGTATYEDVANVDSVGIITAQAGVNVTGGRVLIGTTTAPTVAPVSGSTLVLQGYVGSATGDSLLSLQRGQAPADISSGAQLGGISFGANNGSQYAQIAAFSDGAGGSGDYPGKIVFSTTADTGSAPSPRLTITSGGNIGAGAENPQATLQVGAGFNSNNGTLLISADNSLHNYIRFTNGGATESHYPSGIWYQPAGRMELRAASSASASNAAQLVLASDGNLGVGNNNPLYKLSVLTSGTTDTVLHLATSGGASDNGDATNSIRFTGGTNTRWANAKYEAFDHIFNSNGGEKLRIHSDGTVVVGSSSSKRTGFFNSDAITPILQVETTGPTDAGRMISLVSNAGASTGYCPTFIFGKSRGTAVDSNTGVANNDELGAISFQGADGSHLVESARIVAEVAATTGTDNIPGRLKFHTNYGTSSPTLALEIGKDQDILYYGSTGSANGAGGVNITKRSTEGGSGSMDIEIPGGTFVGTLYVSNVYTSGANARTVATYFVAGRLGYQVTITQLNSATGTSGLSFTITDGSTQGVNNRLRWTNTSGVTANVSMHFVGAIGL